MEIRGYGDGFGDYSGGGYGSGHRRTRGNGDVVGYHDGNGSGDSTYTGKGNCHNKCSSSTNLRALYVVHPYAYLTLHGYPHDDTFENYAFHLQAEQLVHRRV